ncbi:MAG: helicase-related protein, partial [Cardiobacteriaceae bacterium]|nr:helicase-related protein [Cardiobacteriaceae bacterium]
MQKNELISYVKNQLQFSFDETFEIYKKCANLLTSNEQDGKELLIYILNYHKKFSMDCDQILADLIESVGFYPYLEKENLNLSSTSTNIRKYTNQSNYLNNKVFHDDQKAILDLIYSQFNLVISAPTSFGKSLLIEEIVASEKFKNILIIQPTLSLLDETRRNLKKYNSAYKIITKTTQTPRSQNNIFLFTAERTNEYQFFPDLDFLIIDEFYKLSAKRDDGRSAALNNAFLRVLQYYKNIQFYLLGPNIEGISEGFQEKYNARFIAINTKLVASEEHNLFEEYPNQFGDRGAKRNKKEEVLFNLLSTNLFDENTLIYCSSPKRAHDLSRKYTSHLCSKNIDKLYEHKNKALLEWLNEYVSKNWSLSESLKYGVAVHDGTMPKHLLSSILESFNTGSLRHIFCTSTIIEGVNTNAQNIICFDGFKGKQNNKIDYFDYSNIKGRAGRLMKHYIGHIYNFIEPPKHKAMIVDIPFYQQQPIQDEVLINLMDDEVLHKDTDQYKFIKDLEPKEKLLYSQNGICIKGQKELFDHLKSVYKEKYSLLNWRDFPTRSQRQFCLQLIWDYLINEEADKRFFYNKFNNFDIPIGTYIYEKNINILIDKDINYWKNKKEYKKFTNGELHDLFIQRNFKFLRLYIQFKIP